MDIYSLNNQEVLVITLAMLASILIGLTILRRFLFTACPSCKAKTKKQPGKKIPLGNRKEVSSYTRGSFNPFREEAYKAWEVITEKTYQISTIDYRCSNCGAEWQEELSELVNLEKTKYRIPNDQFHF